jgi:hypothetical protein
MNAIRSCSLCTTCWSTEIFSRQYVCLQQETHAELADRTGYHVVEFRKECDKLPMVVASPSPGVPLTEAELQDEEEDLLVDFDRLYYGGRCELVKIRPPPHLKSWPQTQAEKHFLRNQPQAQIMRRAGLW